MPMFEHLLIALCDGNFLGIFKVIVKKHLAYVLWTRFTHMYVATVNSALQAAIIGSLAGGSSR